MARFPGQEQGRGPAQGGVSAGTTSGGGAGGGIDVRFSDDRFVQRILIEAQRGAGGPTAEAAAKRLQDLGFCQEVAKLALNVTGGDEKRALEVCMSGLSFVGSSGCRGGGDPGAPLVDRVPQTPLRCYICGQRHLTDKSLDFHVKACRRRFEQREAKRPPKERRPLLEASELPDGVECLDSYYGQMGAEYPIGGGEEESSLIRALRASKAAVVRIQSEADVLIPCQFCKRTFLVDRLDTHQRVCLQRPRPDPSSPPPPPRRSMGAATPPPPAARRAYEDFCNQLEKCQGCARMFKPDVLQAHVKVCGTAQNGRGAANRPPPGTPVQPRRPPLGPTTGRRSTGGGGGSPGQAGQARAAGGGGRGALHVGGSSSSTSPAPAAAARRSRSATSAGAGAAPTGALIFIPPGRQVPGAPPPAPVVAPVTQAELAQQSAEALVARGCIIAAPSEVEAVLRLQLAERLPAAEFVGAYQANDHSLSVYNALKATMQAQRGGEPPLELELWHGTAWATIPKILRQGFNRSFAGRHGTLLGVATYFSVDPAYSQRFCDKRGGGRDGTKAMLLSRVLVGKYCKGLPSDVEPPLANTETGERYDSTVDNEERPGMFAVFRDFQAVPLFLLEFRMSADRKSGAC